MAFDTQIDGEERDDSRLSNIDAGMIMMHMQRLHTKKF